jgi:hypothetical protein
MHLKTETNLTILATLSEPVPVESHMSSYLKRRKDNKIGTEKKKNSITAHLKGLSSNPSSYTTIQVIEAFHYVR